MESWGEEIMINYYQKDIETMQRGEMRALQMERLKKTISFCYNNVPYYHKLLTECGVHDGSRMRRLSDIQYIPFTTEDDLKKNYPVGFLGVPQKDITNYHISNDKKEKPFLIAYTKEDNDILSDCFARLAISSGINSEDIIQYNPLRGGYASEVAAYSGFNKTGATVISTYDDKYDNQVQIMKELGVTTLIGTPSYGLYLYEYLMDHNLNLDDFKFRIGHFGLETCTAELCSKIEERLNIFISDNYGLSEFGGPVVAGDCIYKTGLHIAEDHFYPEIIDYNFRQVKSIGETGELVLTTLTKRGMPLLRYRTGDITNLNYDVCSCGRTSVRMSKVLGRVKDILKFKELSVFPSEIEQIIMSCQYLSPYYQIVTGKNKKLETIEVIVEMTKEAYEKRDKVSDKLKGELESNLKSQLGINAKLVLVAPKKIERFDCRAKRIIELAVV